MPSPEGASPGPGRELEETHPLVRRVGFFLGPALFLLVLAWPDLPLSSDQRRVAAVTAWTAAWWITVALPIGVTALLPAALLPLTGVMGAREVAPLYMHDLVLLFLGAFVIALGLERWNVHRRMAFWIIARVGTRPRNLVLGFMIAAAFLSMWINNTSTTLLLLPIGMAVVTSLEAEGGDRGPFAIALLLGMAYAASVGGTGTLIGTPPNQIFAGVMSELYPEAPAIDFGSWMLAWLPLVVLFLPIAWIVLTRVALKVSREGSGDEAIRREREKLGPMSRAEWTMAAVFVATATLWVTRKDTTIGSFTFHGWVDLLVDDSVEDPGRFLTDSTVALVMAILCFVLPSGRADGARIMDWPTASRLPWEVLLLLGSGLVIAGSFQASGLDAVVGERIAPLLEGRPDWMVVAMIVLFVAALTEVTSNLATTAVLLPVLGQAAVSAGVSPLFTMLPATIAASSAFMLPVATPPNAVVFASRRVPAPTMARVGIWLNLVMAVLITLVFELWVRRALDVESGLPPWAE